MEVPLLRFVREFETHIRFLQGTHPSMHVYLQCQFPDNDTTLTFDNEMSHEENGAPVYDWTLWNGDETEIRAYDAAEECETDEGWCSTGVDDNSMCRIFVRYSPIVEGKCVNRSEIWQHEGLFCETALKLTDGLGTEAGPSN